MKHVQEQFLKNLKLIRKEKYNTKTICELANVSNTFLYYMENSSVDPKFKNILKVLNVLDINFFSLFNKQNESFINKGEEFQYSLLLATLKYKRTVSDYTQVEFSYKTGIEQGHLSRIERGQDFSTRLSFIIKYLDGLNIDILNLFEPFKYIEGIVSSKHNLEFNNTDIYIKGINDILNIIGG